MGRLGDVDLSLKLYKAESKRYPRVFVMETVIRALRKALRRRPSGGR